MNVNIYVDGSYTKGQKVTHGGIVMYRDGESEPFMKVRVSTENPVLVDMWNQGGELLSAIAALRLLDNLASDGQQHVFKIYYDFIGIAAIACGTWKNLKKSGTIWYSREYKAYCAAHPNVKVVFHKVKAHTGIKGNELADRIAGGVEPAQQIKL